MAEDDSVRVRLSADTRLYRRFCGSALRVLAKQRSLHGEVVGDGSYDDGVYRQLRGLLLLERRVQDGGPDTRRAYHGVNEGLSLDLGHQGRFYGDLTYERLDEDGIEMRFTGRRVEPDSIDGEAARPALD